LGDDNGDNIIKVVIMENRNHIADLPGAQQTSLSGNQDQVPSGIKSKMLAGKMKAFVIKYFWEGQKLTEKQTKALENLDPDASFAERLMVKHRRLIGILIPLVFFEVCWWLLAVRWDFFSLFPERYILSITMIFGATVAGMTSEGGGAVAFPVMTLALGIAPSVARDFSLMIQSCGMTAAAFTIFWMKIKLEWHSVVFCSFGAIFGMVLGLEVFDSMLTPPVKKLSFVCIWFSFAFALFLLNRHKKRRTFDSIPNFGFWQGAILVFVGVIGGVFSAVAGSGVDICSFSVLSLLFRVSEKVSTPTSIILMAINTCVGFFWRALMTDSGVEPEAWKYLAVCVPIVVFFAPFGSIVSSHFHRQVLAALIYVIDTVALITAFAVIPMTLERGLLSGGLIIGGFIFFFLINKGGERFLRSVEQGEERAKELAGTA